LRALIKAFGYFNSVAYLHPDFMGSYPLLYGGVKPCGNNVVDAMLLQKIKYLLAIKAAIGSQQAYLFTMQFRKCVLQKTFHVIATMGIPAPQPKVGHHPAFRHKSHQRMMRRATRLFGVISFFRPLLQAVSGVNAAIQV